MADKIARTHTHKSNRASTKDSDNNERRTVFKSVLDNPYKIPWYVCIIRCTLHSLLMTFQAFRPREYPESGSRKSNDNAGWCRHIQHSEI